MPRLEQGASTSPWSKPASSAGRSSPSRPRPRRLPPRGGARSPRAPAPGRGASRPRPRRRRAGSPSAGSSARSRLRSPSAPRDEPGQLRTAALRPDPPLGQRFLVDPLDPVRAGDVGGLLVDLAAHEPDNRLGRLVLGAHEGDRIIRSQLTPPGVGDPVRVGGFKADSVGVPPRATSNSRIPSASRRRIAS